MEDVDKNCMQTFKKCMHIKIQLNMQTAKGMTLSQESASPVFVSCVDRKRAKEARIVNKKLGHDLQYVCDADGHTGRQLTKSYRS